MLCPNCGVDVGDVSRFCERCQQERISGAASGGIGRIIPKQVYRTVTEEERKKILRDRAEYYSGKSGKINALKGRKKIVFQLVLGAIGVFVIFAGLLLIFNPDRKFWRSLGFDSEEQGPVELFPTVQPAAAPGLVDEEQIGFERFGSVTVDGVRRGIAEIVLSWRPEVSAVSIACFSPEGRSDADLPIPVIRVLLQYEKGAKNNVPESLRGYEVKILRRGRLYSFSREFSGKTSAFGEVAHLAGRLAIGEPIIGSMRSDAFEEIDGNAVKFSWDLRFTGILEKAK